MSMRVRFARYQGLYAVLAVDFGDMWIAGLLTEAARDEYVRRNNFEVVT
jgi:hypothetical protein